MRRSRRGLAGGGHEFGGSGEDSFVAVVVTKLTGALLFILLLTMVIMALIPKADEAAKARQKAAESGATLPLRIVTPEGMPEAIAGHPYAVALAAEGGAGRRKWSVQGDLPEGLALDAETGLIHGTPKAGTPEPALLALRVEDGADHASATARLLVYQPDSALTVPSRWRPGLPALPWRAWMEHGFGFLVLLLIHFVGMNALAGLERMAANPESPGRVGRFAMYRLVLRLASSAAAVALAVWIWRG